MTHINETQQKAREAWLISWNWAGEHAKVENRIAAIVSSRQSQSSIVKIVEQIWASRQLCWFEQVAYARFNKNIAYHATEREMFEGQVTCGHNPWLEANRVYDLQSYLDENGRHHLKWQYIKFSLKGSEVESVYIPYHLIKEADGAEHFID